MSQAQIGILNMVAACVIWGLSGLYYKLLSHIPAIEILSHRTLWSAVFFVAVLAVQGRLKVLGRLLADGRQVVTVACAALMIACNWFFFIWSVGAGRATEASLGYYIFPLVAVLLGRVVFGERLSPAQWAAVALAGCAVAVLTLGLGVLPYISLLLASTFGIYGVLKKRIAHGPIVTVSGEVVLLTPIALIVMMFFATPDGAGLDRVLAVGTEAGLSWRDMALLMLSGPLTATPLILFSAATHRVPMATVGLVQYINPTLQFLVAALVFAEPVTLWHQIAFPMIWVALALYSWTALRQDRAARRLAMHSSTELVVPQSSLRDGSAKP